MPLPGGLEVPRRIQSYLQASGSFNSVDIIDCVSQLITLADLLPCDAVVTFSNLDYFDSVNVGDTLAGYADTGGGVLSTLFANTSTMPARQLGGRWVTGGYEVIEAGLDHQFNTASLGAILDPLHPSVQGVTTLTEQVAFRPEVSTGLLQGSVIAQWDDGAILVAQGDMPNRIDLGMYPPSSDCTSFLWDSAGDGDLLMLNSLLALANPSGPGGIGTGYCMTVANETGASGVLAALGSLEVSSNDVILFASSLPTSSFAFFITSQMQGSDIEFRLVEGAAVRLQIEVEAILAITDYITLRFEGEGVHRSPSLLDFTGGYRGRFDGLAPGKYEPTVLLHGGDAVLHRQELDVIGDVDLGTIDLQGLTVSCHLWLQDAGGSTISRRYVSVLDPASGTTIDRSAKVDDRGRVTLRVPANLGAVLVQRSGVGSAEVPASWFTPLATEGDAERRTLVLGP